MIEIQLYREGGSDHGKVLATVHLPGIPSWGDEVMTGDPMHPRHFVVGEGPVNYVDGKTCVGVPACEL
jgi:hypothetical protein